jgi:DNA-directed RNA polymerase specialized sigma24 family protein
MRVPSSFVVAPGRTSESSRAELMRALGDAERAGTLRDTLRARARRHHGIRSDDADDVFQDAVTTYLIVNGKYPDDANHFGLLFGIFRRRSQMFLRADRTRRRANDRLVERLLGRRPDVARGEDPRGTTLDRLVRDESASLIRRAIAAIEADRRDLLLAFAERRASRLDLAAAGAVNPDTLDSRLRSARRRLMRSLEAVGVA